MIIPFSMLFELERGVTKVNDIKSINITNRRVVHVKKIKKICISCLLTLCIFIPNIAVFALNIPSDNIAVQSVLVDGIQVTNTPSMVEEGTGFFMNDGSVAICCSHGLPAPSQGVGYYIDRSLGSSYRDGDLWYDTSTDWTFRCLYYADKLERNGLNFGYSLKRIYIAECASRRTYYDSLVWYDTAPYTQNIHNLYNQVVAAAERDEDNISGNLHYENGVVMYKGSNGYGARLAYYRTGNAGIQNLLVYTPDIPLTGYVNLNKTSSNPEITNGNSYYSLAGAVYGVYTEWGCYNEVGRLTTDEWGNTNTLELNAGTYYVKELIAPQGFALDYTTYEVVVTAGQTATVSVTDIPQSDPVSILLQKVDAETGLAVPQGDTSLANAEFTIKYFSGLYGTNPEEQGIQPTRTWILKTDNDGFSYLSDEWKVSGDKFYYNSQGSVTLPIGTITIQETKAPEGYLLNSEIFVMQITSEGTNQFVNTYNAPIIPEQVMRGSVELYKSDDESSNALAGAVYGIYFHDGTEVGRLTTDETGYAKSDLLPYGQYYLQEITAPNGYVLDTAQYPFMISTDGQAAVVETSDKLQKGTINIQKTDNESGKPLANAEYEIYAKEDIVTPEGIVKHTAGELLDTVTTNENGFAKSKELYLGTYTVKEKTAPEGYVLDETEYEVMLTYGNPTASIVYSNLNITNTNQKGVIQISKTDNESGKPLANAEYEIYAKKDIVTPEGTVKHTAGELLDTVTTNENGFAKSKELYLGTYIVKEKTAPEGYILNRTEFDVTLTYGNQTEQVIVTSMETMNANQKGRIKGIKTGEVLTGNTSYSTDFGAAYSPSYEVQPLAGAIYDIYAKYDIITPEGTVKYTAGQLIETVSTNKNGEFLSDDLYLGTYIVKEKQAPKGYVQDTTEYEVTLSYGGQNESIVLSSISLSNERQKVILSFRKELEQHSVYPDSDAYRDVRFGLYVAEDILDVNGNIALEKDSLLEVITLDENLTGTVITDLPIGSYYLQEIATNKAYVLNTTKYPIDFTYQGQETTTVEIATNNGQAIVNELQKGQVNLYKTSDESGKPLANAVYGIYSTDGTEVSRLTTDETGYATSNLLPYGSYYLQEITAPEGCIINNEQYPFTISTDGQVITINTTNKNQLGIIEGKKTGEVLTGSDFRLTELGMMYSPIYEVQGLPNAMYEIYAKEDIVTPDGTIQYTTGQLVETVTTDKNGQFASWQLYLGTYVIKEKTAPDGYVQDTTEYEVTLSYGGQNESIVLSSISLSNERQKVILSFRKELEQHSVYPDSDAYRDVRFGLYVAEDILDVNGNIALEKDSLLEVITLDENLTGTVITDLPIGSYYLQEIATNKAYVLNTTKYPIDFTYQGQETTTVEIAANNGQAIVNELQKGQVELIKESDFPTGALEQGFVNHPLEGAVYGIYSTDGKEVGRLTTDITGHAKSELLPYGSYYLKEISAPFGYEINETEYPFTIGTDGQLISVTVLDEPKIGTIYPEDYNSNKNLPSATTGDTSIYLVGVLFIISIIILIVKSMRKDLTTPY